ncbi:MAG: septum formation initiator family protein [Actinobacteria bacterium]|nr:septum formation initiator family protein [Actinomycetota bacterium]
MKRVARVAVALLVLVALLFLAGFPARTYFDQRNALAATTDRLEVLRKSNKTLSGRTSELQSDAAVERLAREQYNLVRPGEEAYAILPGPEGPAPAKVAAPAPKKQSWLDKVADTLSFWN